MRNRVHNSFPKSSQPGTRRPGTLRTATLVFSLALFATVALGQGHGPQRGSNYGWGDDGQRYRDRDDGRWDDDRGYDGYGDRWNRSRRWSGAYPLDPRFRVREGDYRGRRGGRFEFRGRIDDEVLFFIRGGRVTVQNIAGRGMSIERWSLDDPLPVGRPVRIDIDREDGRGRVQLVEAPNPRNNYTAVVRVFDPSGGSDRYHFQVEWRY